MVNRRRHGQGGKERMSKNQEEKLEEIDIDLIDVNTFQPRNFFGDKELKELADSISAVGLIHPPIVRKLGEKYELVSGERRLRAAKLAGFKKISVVIRNEEGAYSAEAALIENIQRVDLNPIDIARALHQLMNRFSLNQEALAMRIGKKRSTVSNYLRLLALSTDIQEGVAQNTITMGHAKAILSVNSVENQNNLYQQIIEKKLSVRKAEDWAKKCHQSKIKKNKNQDIYRDQLSRLMEEKLGTKVNITGKGQKGRIKIDFYNYEDVERILKILSIEL